jgi:hypothetical protein
MGTHTHNSRSAGDNGASAEGTLNGCLNEASTMNGMAGIETPEFLMSKIDDFGGPKAYNHYAVGLAHAMTRRISGPSKWRRILGTRNGGSCTGPTASRVRARSGHSSVT